MKRRAMSFALCAVFLQGVYACEDEVKDNSDPEVLVDSCESYCEAASEIDCEGSQSLTESQCKLGCAFLPQQLNGLCIAEYTASFDCIGDSEFMCFEGIAIPENAASCLTEAESLVTCLEGIECRGYCESVVAAGCGGTDVDTCIADCEGQIEELNEQGACGFEYQRLIECQTDEGITCNGEQPSADGCEEEALDVGSCIASFDNTCAGYCWASERLGCGDECMTTCEQNSEDATCGRDYEQLLDCHLRSWDATCNAGELTAPDDCSFDQESWETCTAGG